MNKKLLFFLLIFPLLAIGQHTIKGTFSPPKDYKWAILSEVTPTNVLYTADAKVDSLGKFTITLDSTVTQGIYRLVYALPQDVYNFDIIYDGKENIEFTFNEEEGITFLASNENRLLTSYQNAMQAIQTEIGRKYQTGYSEVKRDFKMLEKTQNEFEKQSDGMIVSHFIKANRSYIPESSEDMQTYIDKTKKTYFDNIDFKDPVLQSSNFLTESVFNYITSYVGKEDNILSDYEKNIDMVFRNLQKTKPKFQQVMLMRLWQRFVDMDRIPTANYIAEKYLIPVSKSLGDSQLAEQLTVFKNTSLGSKAPDFKWEEASNGKVASNSLYQLDVAEKYILVFWSSSCSHCLMEVPLLHSKISELKKGKYKVIAIGLEDEPYDWQNEIHNFSEFLNVLGLEKWDNEIGNKYGLDATPTYFVLDADKKIIAKPEHYEDLLKLLEK